MPRKRSSKQSESESPTSIAEADLDSEISSLEAVNVKEDAESSLNEKQLTLLKRIAYYIGKVGLDVNEACTLVGVPPKNFREEMRMFPAIQRVIEMKELEYKKDLLATLSSRARGGDDKIAQWLLEMKDPIRFGKKRSGSGDGSEDIMAQAIEYVQSSESGGLIQTTSGRAVVINKGGLLKPKMSTEALLNRVNKISGIKP